MTSDESDWSDFLNLCFKVKNKKQLGLLLDFFLTAEEKSNIAMRHQLIKELIRGDKTQREIAKDLNISIAKITRGSNELKKINRELLNYLKE